MRGSQESTEFRIDFRRWTRLAALGLAVTLGAVGCLVLTGNDETAAWFEPLMPNGPETLADVCSEVCTADLVVLPELRVVESVVDLPMPETTGVLSIERVWTGERGAIFGTGWETLWDIRLRKATLSGPLPAEPVAQPGRDSVELVDGTTLEFDSQGRPVNICADGAVCTAADWSDRGLRLSAGFASVNLVLEEGRAISATSSDGRTVEYSYDDGRLTRATSEAGEIDYSYESGRLSKIGGVPGRTFDYLGDTLQSMTDRNGDRWSFLRMSPGEIQVTEPNGEKLTYTFAQRSLTKVSEANRGVVLERTFADGGLFKEERPLDGITLTRIAPNEFEVTQRRDLEPSRRSLVTVDQLGRVVRTVSSSGEMLVSYDGRSNRPATTRVGEHVTTFQYDARGLLTGTIDPDGYRVTLERDALGLVTSVTDGLLATQFEYDAAGRPIREESAGRAAVANLDPSGLVRSLSLTGGSSEVAVSYDESGALQSVGDDTATAALAELGGSLSETPVIDDSVAEMVELSTGWEYRYTSGRVARFDQWGRLTELQVEGRSTVREYDDAGQLTALTLPDGRTYSLSYTDAGRIASVSDGTVTADLEWHGDLLTSVTTSSGSAYRYDYDASGRLTSSETGPARWNYQYDDAGNLAQVIAPSGTLTYEWDDRGRPLQSLVNGQLRSFDWGSDGADLVAVAAPDRTLVGFERDAEGRVTSMETPDGEATFEYSGGALTRYQLADGADVAIAYSPDSKVASIRYGDVTEQWEWNGGELEAVTIDDERYDLDWLAPGLLASVARDGATLMTVKAGSFGRAESVHDEDDDLVGAFEWSPAGLSRAALDDWVMEVDYDQELRPVRLAADGVVVTSDYEGGLPTTLTVGDTSITGTYADGRLVASRLERQDQWVDVTWSEDGQPTSFASSEGRGSFDYVDGRIETISYDDRVRQVTYDGDGRPSAEGTGGEFVDDLFSGTGVFAVSSGEHLAEPWAPWFDALPQEIGLALPAVVTGDDVVEAAIDQATPDIPMPIAPTDNLARRTAQTIVALAGPSAFPVSGDRNASLPAQPVESDLSALLAELPTAVVGDSVFERLADGPCLLCRVVDAGAGALSALGRAGGAVAGFLTDTVVGRAVLSVAFFLASFAVGTLCVAGGICSAAFGIAAPLVLAMMSSGADDLAGALYAAVLAPMESLWRGIRELDPATLLSVALTVAAFRAGASSGARFTSLRAKAVAPVCNIKRVVCISVSRFGSAAEHVVDAQRNGASRVLKLDRAGAEARRTSALRNVPLRAGFDRDEYPFAISSQRAGLSIRYVDPGSNRSLGVYLRRQLSALPDGARFLVLPIG